MFMRGSGTQTVSHTLLKGSVWIDLKTLVRISYGKSASIFLV